jgi:hypothetical protein
MSSSSETATVARSAYDLDGVLDIDSLKQFTIPKKNKAKTGIYCRIVFGVIKTHIHLVNGIASLTGSHNISIILAHASSRFWRGDSHVLKCGSNKYDKCQLAISD